MCGHNGDTCHNLVLKRSSGIPSREMSCLELPKVHRSGVCGPGECWRFLQTLPHCFPGAFLTPSLLVMVLPPLLVLFSPPFLLFPVPSLWLSIFHWQLDCREEFLSWLLPPTKGTTILLRRETLVLLDQGRAGSPHCHGQSPWWPLALLPGHRSRDTA